MNTPGKLLITFNNSYKIISRYIRNSTSITLTKTKRNPGIQKRATLLEDQNEIENINEIDDLESDFMGVGMSYSEHVEEEKFLRERNKRLIVKQKYFKDNYPNFLTWSEKEQIRYLHRTDPNEWTILKLSESFPALPQTIEKIVKASWSKSVHKITNHDNSVQKNWEDFKQGKLNLPQKLTDHLKKFTERDINKVVSTEMVQIKEENGFKGEFSEIITSFMKIKNKENKRETISKEIDVKKKKEDTYVLQDDYDKKDLITLEGLKEKIVDDFKMGKEIDEDDKLLLNSSTSRVELKPDDSGSYTIPFKYESSVALRDKKEKKYDHLIYPEVIKIPSKLRKRECVYKLNDCYYDYDGKFLYRVPGMEK